MMPLVFIVLVTLCLALRFAVRPSPIAGQWYPDEPAALASVLQDYLDQAESPEDAGRPRALVSPHAGYAYSGPCAAHAYKTLEGQAYDRVIVLAPSHRVAVGGVSVGDYDAFETPLGQIEVDREAGDTLTAAAPFAWDRSAHAQEHSLEIQLPFLQHVLKEFTLVPLVVQGLDRGAIETVAEALAGLLDDKTLVVISSDFTHYGASFGYVPFTDNVADNLRKLDMGAAEKVEQNDLGGFLQYCQRNDCTICGREPIAVMMSLADEKNLPKPRLLKYATSGEMTGDYSHVVSYVAMGYFE